MHQCHKTIVPALATLRKYRRLLAFIQTQKVAISLTTIFCFCLQLYYALLKCKLGLLFRISAYISNRRRNCHCLPNHDILSCRAIDSPARKSSNRVSGWCMTKNTQNVSWIISFLFVPAYTCNTLYHNSFSMHADNFVTCFIRLENFLLWFA